MSGVLSMGSENEIPIPIYSLPWDDMTRKEVVLYSDHVAVRKADQERIAELEAQVGMLSAMQFDWFLCGFQESGEGYNGEYLKGNDPSEDYLREELLPAFNEISAMARASLSTGETD